MTSPMGVRDAEYIELFRGFLGAKSDPLDFRKRFFATYLSDGRLGDEERYEVLQRVFFGCEDLEVDHDLRDDDEIDESELRTIVGKAAHDLAHRRDDWEGRHAGDGPQAL